MSFAGYNLMLQLIQNLLRGQTGVALTALNLLLALILVLQSNPFGIFASGYAGASPLIDVAQSEVDVIELIDPDAAPMRVRLVRGQQLPREQWTQPVDDAGWFSRREPEYAWQLQIAGGSGSAETEDATPLQFEGDSERVAALFSALINARRHHYVPRSPEKDRDLEMSTDAQGVYEGLQLRLILNGGETETIFVGRSSLRGNQSYLRLNDETEIYLAETNLRSAVGPGEADYFRRRALLPASVTSVGVTGIHAELSGNAGLISLVKDGGIWRMQSPPTAAKLRGDQVQQLIAALAAWKAVAFPDAEQAATDYETPPEFPFALRLEYKTAGNLTDRGELIFSVLGRKNFSNYLVRTVDGTLAEVNSLALEDLLNPLEKLVDRESAPAVSPLLQ